MKYFISCFLLCCSLHGIAQNGSIIYSHTFYGTSSQGIESQHTLYFDQVASVFHQSLLTANMPKEEIPEPTDSNHEVVRISIVDSVSTSIYYRELKSRTVTCRASALNKQLKSKVYLYEDEGAQQIDWELKDEFKTISGYECQKASVTFRGRNYDAWFTTEIPVPYGPWKLGGLPGLILEVYDDTKEISFSVEKINIPDSEAKSNIVMPEGMAISHKEFVSLSVSGLDRIRKSRISALIKGGGRLLSSTTTSKSIELDYEWSKE